MKIGAVHIFFIVFSCCVLMLTACSNDEDIYITGDPFNNTPHISVKTATPNPLQVDTDSLTLLIHYFDGDGDLGTTDTAAHTIFISDSRLQNDIKSFYIPPLAPTDQKITIEGDLKVQIKMKLLDSSAASEEAIISVWLNDRKGNECNVAVSPTIELLR